MPNPEVRPSLSTTDTNELDADRPRPTLTGSSAFVRIAGHISGQPHRIKYLEAIYDHVRRFEGVLHWNGAEILDWYLSAAKQAKPGVAA